MASKKPMTVKVSIPAPSAKWGSHILSHADALKKAVDKSVLGTLEAEKKIKKWTQAVHQHMHPFLESNIQLPTLMLPHGKTGWDAFWLVNEFPVCCGVLFDTPHPEEAGTCLLHAGWAPVKPGNEAGKTFNDNLKKAMCLPCVHSLAPVTGPLIVVPIVKLCQF